MNRRTFLQSSAALAAVPLFAADKVDPYVDAKFAEGEPPRPAKDSFTLAVLPDTQHYSEKFPENYHAQTKWIVENREARNIAAVLHLGDITNRNSKPEWENAASAMQRLDKHVPYFLCPGNHDYSVGGGCKDRTTLLNNYFPVANFKGRPTFGGTYDKEPDRMENNYHLFSAGGREFMVLDLEFGPRADVLRWANTIAGKYPKREIILVSHALIYHDDTRFDRKKYGAKQAWNPHAYALAKATQDDICDGQEIWDGLVSKHENFIMTLNGHVLGDGLGRVTTATPAGRDIPQMLVNFQMKPNGGDGWLRLLECKSDGTVEVYDYSPTLKKRNESVQNRFAVKLAPVKA